MKPPTRPVVLLILISVVLLVGVMRPSPAQDTPKPAAPKKLMVMERKLLHAQKVLEGLALEDYKKIETSADGLIECVKDASWKINDTEKYTLYSTDFLRRAEDLRKAAKDKNINAAALSYMDMTLTCVKCHQHLRDSGKGRVPDISLPTPKSVAAN